MPQTLGDAEFEILERFSDSGDRIGYYGQLEDWGYKYGELARGVVTDDQLSGRTANNFFLDRAEDQLNAYNDAHGFEPNDVGYASPEITKTDMAELSQALMQADLEARRAEQSPNRYGERLSVETVERYHADAFEDQFSDRMDGGINIEAWTPYEALQKRETMEAREELWDNMLEQPAMITAFRTVNFGDYGREQAGSGILAGFGQEGDVGPYIIDNPNGNGKVIAGTGGHDGTLENPFRGTDGSDIIYTFPGHDVVSADAGNDMIYSSAGNKIIDGGTDIDFINYRAEQASDSYGSPAYAYPGGSSLTFTAPINALDTDINVVDGETLMNVEKTGAETYFLMSKMSEYRASDSARNVEGYLGSDLPDTVNLNGTTHDLYLDGGLGDEDTFRARLPEGVEAGAIFDSSAGIIPENHKFETLPYDSRLYLESGETVYIVNFEHLDVGRVEEGFVIDATPEAGVIPEISITNPDVLDGMLDRGEHPDASSARDVNERGPSTLELEIDGSGTKLQFVSYSQAVQQFADDRELLRASDPEATLTITQAANHDEAEAMFVRLYDSGIENFPAEATQGETPEDRVGKTLLKAQEIDTALEAERTFEPDNSQSYNAQSHEDEIDYGIG